MPVQITVEQAIERIRNGNSKDIIEQLRKEKDDDMRKHLKMSLPAVTFSGEFKDRNDDGLVRHSGFVCLDFDHVAAPEVLKRELSKNQYIFACWLSPSGDGVKALVKISDKTKHYEHYESLIQDFKCDPSCKNVGRLCFESYDPYIYMNVKASTYTKEYGKVIELSDSQKFDRLLKWLTDSGNAFRSGERNIFIFKLASACCRVGIQKSECEHLMLTNFPVEKSFTQREALMAINSAYKSNSFNSCELQGETVFQKEDGLQIDPAIFNMEIKPKDIIYASDCTKGIIDLWEHGWIGAETTYVEELDKHWKWKRGDLNVLSGYGNHGKSALLYYLCLVKSVKEGKRFCIFSPETYPAEAFYFDMVEMYLGMDCTPKNLNRPPLSRFEEAFEFVNEHFFYIYPSELSPTPEYLKERFLEMIIKERVDCCIIDPFNQMENTYEKGQREDQYLSTILSDFSRFIKQNDIFFFIVAHPHKPIKGKDDKDYPCPTVFNLSGGAMWNNKADNILIYHRPYYETDPLNPLCEIHSKKIKRQKEVGIPGMCEMRYDRRSRRFVNFNDYSPLNESKTNSEDLF